LDVSKQKVPEHGLRPQICLWTMPYKSKRERGVNVRIRIRIATKAGLDLPEMQGHDL
jgi:hypothetical protein